MRSTLLIALLAFALAACGGAEPSATAEPDAAATGAASVASDAPPVRGVIEAEPVLEDYRGAPLAIVFFHPF